MAELGSGNILPALASDEHAEVNGHGAKKVVQLNAQGGLADVGNLYTYMILDDGSIKYLAKAVVGSELTDAAWQVQKIDQSSGVRITWADGNTSFDNTADDLSSLTYS